MKVLSLLTTVIVVSICIPVNASSVIHTELATLESVRVFAATGSLGFEAIPELDSRSIRAAIEQMASEVLELQGVAIDPESEVTLYLVVDKSHKRTNSGYVAVSVRAELVESVSPTRPIIWTTKSPFQATTWDYSDIDLLRREDATEDTLEMVKIALERFTGSVESARAYCESEGLWRPE